MSATSRVDVVSDVMSQVAAVSCIHDPTLDATVASQSARKTGWRRGSQAEAADAGLAGVGIGAGGGLDAAAVIP